MANRRRQRASWQTFHPVHPMEDLMPGGVRLPREEPPDPMYALLEKELEEVYDGELPCPDLLYDSGDPEDYGMEEFDDEGLVSPVDGGSSLAWWSVPPPEQRPKGWMPCPEVDDFRPLLPRAGHGHADADAAAAEGVEGPAGGVAAVLPRLRRLEVRTVGDGAEPGPLDRLPARPRPPARSPRGGGRSSAASPGAPPPMPTMPPATHHTRWSPLSVSASNSP